MVINFALYPRPQGRNAQHRTSDVGKFMCHTALKSRGGSRSRNFRINKHKGETGAGLGTDPSLDIRGQHSG